MVFWQSYISNEAHTLAILPFGLATIRISQRKSILCYVEEPRLRRWHVLALAAADVALE